MKIRSAEVLVASPGRNFVTLKLTTEDGLYGLGDATLNGRELAVKSYLEDHLAPLLVGRDARRIEDTWQYLYKGAYWRRGPVTMAAIGAVDLALWDIRGKALGVPVYQLLGGASRESVMVYGHANGKDLEDTVAAVHRYREMGYQAIRAQSGIPGLAGVYGISKGVKAYEPAVRGQQPEESLWSSERYLDFAPRLFERLRKEVGPHIHLLHDVHHRLTPIEAARLGKALEPYHLFWMEDAVPAELQEGFRLIRQHTTTPLAVGEVFNSIHDCEALLKNQWIDYIRMTPSHSGGLTALVKIAHFAEVYHVRTGCHGATDMSPICLAAALHFDLAIHNFGVQEYMRHSEETDRVFPHAYTFKEGAMHPGDAPGLGVDLDLELHAKHPYAPAYLPVARQLDGTLHSW
ncbi:MAG TPA: D-mannonate dehydratase ManD [Vicinamibacteria bacterium]